MVCPDSTVTEPGTVTFALLSESSTGVFAGAAADNTMVQAALPAVLNVSEVQLKRLRLTAAGAVRPICAVRTTPFRLAVTVAV